MVENEAAMSEARKPALLTAESFRIEDIYVPVKRRATLDPANVDALAERIIEEGQKIPIMVRRDGDRLVLVEGLHRLEALKALGEETVTGIIVRARQH